jgi:hypothetical protein
MKLEHKSHLNTRNKSPKRFFSNSKISFSILDELKELGFGGTERNLPNQIG